MQQIKGYRIDTIIAERQELTLARATQLSLDRPVFLKILKSLGADPEVKHSFEQEAKLIGRLNHPNIISIYELNLTDEPPFLALEYFAGTDLSALLHEHPLPESQLSHIFRQILTGCAEAHAAGILHGDLKPENILINPKGQIKLTDFGLAGLLGGSKLHVAGTAGYLAPELALGESPSIASEMYALGMTFYTLAAGQNPLVGQSLSDALNLAITKDPPDLRLLRPELADALIRLIERLITKAAAERIKSCERALELLNEISSPSGNSQSQTMQPVLEPPASLKAKGRSQLTLWVAALLVVMLLGLVFQLRPHPVETAVIPPASGRDTIATITPPGLPVVARSEHAPDTELMDQRTANEVPQQLKVLPVAEVQASPESREKLELLPQGSLFITAVPWARIKIDSVDFGVTPLAKAIVLDVGEHAVQFLHPSYPSITRPIEISAEQPDSLNMIWRESLGFLEISVYPWAEVFINSKAIDTTPIKRPIPLQPGEFQLLLKNPKYPPWNQFLSIAAGDTLSVNVKLRQFAGTG